MQGIIFGNRVLDVVFVAWFIAQFYKVLQFVILEKKLNIKRLWETGGMPSSHSSTVTSLTTSIAIKYGITSDIFAITIIFAGIVMYDAAGIRRAAGNQAGAINNFLENLPKALGQENYNKYFGDEKKEKLKELLGHTPIEVTVGGVLGIIVALCFKNYLLG